MVNRAYLISEFEALGQQAGIRFGEPLNKHTSLGIGGEAEVFSVPVGEDALVEVLRTAKKCGARVLALGGGTNLLVRDVGVPGLVVHIGAFDRTEVLDSDGNEADLRVGAGVRLQKLIALCRREGYSGLESLSGIPGLLSGAVAGNAGSYGSEISDVIKEIRLVSFNGEAMTIGVEDAGFRYRGSDLSEAGIITGVTLCLIKSTPEDVAASADGFLKRKQAAQPVGDRSAGCVFKNPEGDSAGRLIESAGCKGMQEGGIVVSRLHANFFINTGQGSAGSFIKLMDDVAAKVHAAYGITLEPEIRVVGR